MGRRDRRDARCAGNRRGSGEAEFLGTWRPGGWGGQRPPHSLCAGFPGEGEGKWTPPRALALGLGGGGVWGECAGENVPPVSLLLPRGALCSLESLAWEGDRVGHSVYCKWSGIPPALGKEFIESDPVTIESQGCPASVS